MNEGRAGRGVEVKFEDGKVVTRRAEGGVGERERVRKMFIQRKWVKNGVAVLFLFGLCFLAMRAGKELIIWVGEVQAQEVAREGEVRLPSVEVIDEVSGKAIRYDEETKKTSGGVSVRTLEFVSELEEEFLVRGLTIIRARVPVGKVREVDIEVEGVSGVVKTSLDRNAAVTAEDAERMIRYLREQEIEEFEYIDIRIARKGYWK